MARLKKQGHGKTSYSVNSNSNSKGSSSSKTGKKLINKRAKGGNELRKSRGIPMCHEIGNYANFHVLFPKNAELIPSNSNVPSNFEEKHDNDFDFSKMHPFEKDLWNLLLQQHPGISEGNALGFLSYYFEKLVILAKFQELRDWKIAAVERILNEKKQEVSEDSDNSTDSFFSDEYEIVEKNRDMECLKQFLSGLSVNLVFDSHFIDYTGDNNKMYCPCNKINKNWNNRSKITEVMGKSDECIIKNKIFTG